MERERTNEGGRLRNRKWEKERERENGDESGERRSRQQRIISGEEKKRE
jgi:hypothetical protein